MGKDYSYEFKTKSEIRVCTECQTRFIPITKEIEAGIERYKCPFCFPYFIEGEFKYYQRNCRESELEETLDTY